MIVGPEYCASGSRLRGMMQTSRPSVAAAGQANRTKQAGKCIGRSVAHVFSEVEGIRTGD